MSNLTVKISKRTSDGVESWEGTAELPGVRPTKIVKAKTGESTFNTRSTLTSAAQRLASRYGFNGVSFSGNTGEETSTKNRSSKKETVYA